MEIRLNAVVAAGRLTNDPVQLEDGSVHFLLQASEKGDPFHCFCAGKSANTVLTYLHSGDEVSVEGCLEFRRFRNESRPTLLIKAEFLSYGRKKNSLAPGDPRGGLSL